MAADPEKSRPNLGEAILSAAVIIFGLLVIWQTTQIRLTPGLFAGGAARYSLHRWRRTGDHRALAALHRIDWPLADERER